MPYNCYHTPQLHPNRCYISTPIIIALCHAYPESPVWMGTGTSSAKYSTDGSILGNSSGANFEKIISLCVYIILFKL